MKAVAAALGLALPLAAAKVDYNGYQAFHIESADDFDVVSKALKDITHVSMGCESNHKGFDIAVAPDSLNAFKKLGLNTKTIHEDLGADIEAEGNFKPYVCAFQVTPCI